MKVSFSKKQRFFLSVCEGFEYLGRLSDREKRFIFLADK